MNNFFKKFKNFKNFSAAVVCVFVVALCFAPVKTVKADTGPKASVCVTFNNLGSELCYATLLSSVRSTGPYSVWTGTEEDAYHSGNERYESALLDYETWKAFVDYKDSDGYYFLQHAVWKISEKSNKIQWGYYPPKEFKILLYYPESKTFASSGICKRYAFDTYYTVDASGAKMSVEYDKKLSGNDRVKAYYRLYHYESYDLGKEILSLAARMIITIALELGVALLFGIRGKKPLLFIVLVNAGTQILLNAALNLISVTGSIDEVYAVYVLLEVIVFMVEAAIYALFTKKFTQKEKPAWFYVIYALAANALSFFAGIALSNIIPAIF